MTEFVDALKTLKQNDLNLGKVIDLINPEYQKKELKIDNIPSKKENSLFLQ